MSGMDLDALEDETRKALRGVEPAYDFAGTEAKLERILRICTRLRAAEARTAWQLIETAPRDEEPVMLWFLTPFDFGDVGRFADGCWRNRSGAAYIGTPVAWQPLPAPPASEVPHG